MRKRLFAQEVIVMVQPVSHSTPQIQTNNGQAYLRGCQELSVPAKEAQITLLAGLIFRLAGFAINDDLIMNVGTFTANS